MRNDERRFIDLPMDRNPDHFTGTAPPDQETPFWVRLVILLAFIGLSAFVFWVLWAIDHALQMGVR